MTRRNKSKGSFLFAAVGLLFTAIGLACGGESGKLTVYVSASPNASEDPLDPSVVRWLRIRVEGPGLGVVSVEQPFERGGSTHLPPVPAGEDRRIIVEGLTGPDGLLVSRGESLPFTLSKKSNEVELYMGLIERFSAAAGGGLQPPRRDAEIVSSGLGSVLVIGGADDETGEPVGRVDSFDPTSGRLVDPLECDGPEGCAVAARWGHTALSTGDGAVFVGGRDSDGPVQSVGLCDGEGCRGRDAKSIERWAGVGVSLPGGGGVSVASLMDGEATTVIDRFDAEGGVEERVHEVSAEGTGLSAGFDGSGGLLLMGFADGFARYVSGAVEAGATVEQEVLEGILHRRAASLVTLGDGRVLIIGGRTESGESLTIIEVFDAARGLVCEAGNLLRGRAEHAAALLRDGRVLVTGGVSTGGSMPAESEVIDPRYLPEATSCERVAGKLEVRLGSRLAGPRRGHKAIALSNGNLLVAGGVDESGEAVGRLEIFVPSY